MTIWENIKWTANLSRGYRLRLLLNIALGGVSVSLSLLFIYLSKTVVDRAVAGEITEGVLTPALQISGVLLAQLACNFVRGINDVRTSTSMMNSLRERLFFRVMLSRWSGRERFHTGDITTRLDGDARKVCETLCSTLPVMAITAFEFLMSFIFMLSLDRRLAWLLFLIMPVSLILSKRYVFNVRKLTHSIREMDSSVQAHIQEQVQYRNIVSAMGHTSNSVDLLRSLSSQLYSKTMNRTNYTLYSRTIVRIGFMAGYLMVFFWGVEGLSSGAITFGIMTAFLQLVAKVQTPIVEISSQISAIAQATTSIDRLVELDDLVIEEQGDPQILSGAIGVNLRNVVFGYGERNVLIGFDYDFSPNKLHIIVGETGSGKSTILRLILGFLTPASGDIELYDNNESIKISPLTRENFVYVPQGNTLISGSVRDNILLGDPSASDEQIAEVLHTAVAEFVYDLPEGLDTICGERGAGLSEGEAQRIAIARGLLRQGGVLLLDEPTSALDSVTEQLLIERLTRYAKNRTMIMVTHRNVQSNICTSVVKLLKNRK